MDCFARKPHSYPDLDAAGRYRLTPGSIEALAVAGRPCVGSCSEVAVFTVGTP